MPLTKTIIIFENNNCSHHTLSLDADVALIGICGSLRLGDPVGVAVADRELPRCWRGFI